MASEHLAELVKSLPTTPGVYLFKEAAGKVIYVGKAASLRARVRSYFQSTGDERPKLAALVPKVADLEFIVTDSEAEALLLENTLIKRHRPPFNTRLKDDKTYPYLKIPLHEPWARPYITRRVESDGARYFGPFASASSLRQTMALIKKLFPYRSCNRVITGKDPRPCLDYYIHRCLAPCIGACTKDQYDAVIAQVVLFLEGKEDTVARQLRAEMQAASAGLDFERAALLRDRLQAVLRVSEQQKAAAPGGDDQDVIALAQGRDDALVDIFFLRKGRIIGREHFPIAGAQGDTPGQVITSFVKQYYDSAPQIPKVVLLQHPIEDQALIEGWLANKRGARVSIRVPRRGKKRELVEMVAANAQEWLQQTRVRWMSDAGNLQGALEELQEQLDLPRLPRRIECYDVSNIHGTNPTASMVVFLEGRSARAHYRKFSIKGVRGIDDYAMMQEALGRRFKAFARGEAGASPEAGTSATTAGVQEAPAPSAAAGLTAPQFGVRRLRRARRPGDGPPPKGADTSFAARPDLILIDGGRGHLNAALEVVLQLGVEDVALASIAKQEELLFTPDTPDPIVLPRSSPALYLVQRIRDEAHRFAITYHRQRRSRGELKSALDGIGGIGPKRRRALLRRFGSVQGIREAPLEEIAAVVGMTRRVAERLKEQL
ncbi:MAG: excinuclease ABC subunit UvrC [Chloroflexi bacterium]|nr:excinuclease ABC subunit UvrC [Chloroflexota bacterium]